MVSDHLGHTCMRASCHRIQANELPPRQSRQGKVDRSLSEAGYTGNLAFREPGIEKRLQMRLAFVCGQSSKTFRNIVPQDFLSDPPRLIGSQVRAKIAFWERQRELRARRAERRESFGIAEQA